MTQNPHVMRLGTFGRQVIGRVLPDVLCIAFVAACAFKLLHDINFIYDVSTNDESNYLIDSVMIAAQRATVLNYAPIYSHWYAAIMKLFGDNALSAYYANYQILTFLLPLSLYGALRVNGARPLLALLSSWLLLIGDGNLYEIKVTAFSATILFIGIAGASLSDNRFVKALVIASFAWIAAFARPEYRLLAVIVLAGGCCWLRQDEWWRRPRNLFLCAASLVVAGVTVFLLLDEKQDPTRLYFAFAQHFADWWGKSHHLGYDPWGHTTEIMTSVFGPIDSISAAVRIHPGLVAHHIFDNVLVLPFRLAQSVFGHVCLLTPSNSLRYCQIESALLPIIGALVAVVTLGRSRVLSFFRDIIRIDRFHLILLAGSAVFLATSALLYPRKHYLLLITALLVYALVLRLETLARMKSWNIPRRPLALAAAGLLLLASTPYLSQNDYYAYHPGGVMEGDPVRLRWLTALQQLRIVAPPSRPFRLVTDFSGISAYMPWVAVVLPKDAAADLELGVLDGILVDDGVRNDGLLADNPRWSGLLRSPEGLGFRRIPLASGDDLLIRIGWGH